MSEGAFSAESERAFASLPRERAEALAAIGRTWADDIQSHRDLVVATYAPVVARAAKAYAGVVHRAIQYGSHARQVLDVYEPSRMGPRRDESRVTIGEANIPPADVLIFVHGGAFIRGARSMNGQIYDNVCYWFADRGLVAVNMEYRLAPAATYPAGSVDVSAAVRWVRDNAARFNGNPDRIFLMGHSAGGTHVATYLVDPLCSVLSRRGIAGAILVSARLYADVSPRNPNADGVRQYYGKDESLYEMRSPLTYASSMTYPTMVVIAQYENPMLDEYGLDFAYRMTRGTRIGPRIVQVRGHNHTSVVAHFNSGENLLADQIYDFMKPTATTA